MQGLCTFRYRNGNFVICLVHFSPGNFILRGAPYLGIGDHFFLLAADGPHKNEVAARNRPEITISLKESKVKNMKNWFATLILKR